LIEPNELILMNQKLLFIGKDLLWGNSSLSQRKNKSSNLGGLSITADIPGSFGILLLLLKIGSKFSRVPGSSLFSKFPSPS
jgi:hypothetical protein